MASSSYGTDRRERAGSIALVLLLHVGLGYALLKGFDVDVPARIDDGLKLFALADPPPPPPVEPAPKPRPHRPRREGASAPANLTAQASPVEAPKPIVPPLLPPPVLTAPIAGIGDRDHAGAAPVRGPGSGSGGVGRGTGSGGDGDGPGGGGGGTDVVLIRDTITNRDYPKAALRAGVGGTVGLIFTVGVKGRVTDCTVTRSSGNADLDTETCRLIREKLRYRPARDAAGRPFPQTVEGEHQWHLDRAQDEDDDDGGDGGGDHR